MKKWFVSGAVLFGVGSTVTFGQVAPPAVAVPGVPPIITLTEDPNTPIPNNPGGLPPATPP